MMEKYGAESDLMVPTRDQDKAITKLASEKDLNGTFKMPETSREAEVLIKKLEEHTK